MGGAVDRRCGHTAEVGWIVPPPKEEPGNVHDAHKGEFCFCVVSVSLFCVVPCRVVLFFLFLLEWVGLGWVGMG